MSQTAHHPAAAHSQAANQYFLTLAADSLSAAPHLSPAEKQARFAAVMDGVMAFLPTEPVQIMLASEAVGIHLSIMEGHREAAVSALPSDRAAKARTIGVAQARMVVQLVREIRAVRKAAQAAEQAEGRAAGMPPSASVARTTSQTPPSGATPVAGTPAPETPVPITAVPVPAAQAAPPAQPAETSGLIALTEASLNVDEATFATALKDYESACAQAGIALDPEFHDLARQMLERTREIVPAQAGQPADIGGHQPQRIGSRAFRRAVMKQRGEFRKVS